MDKLLKNLLYLLAVQVNCIGHFKMLFSFLQHKIDSDIRLLALEVWIFIVAVLNLNIDVSALIVQP